MLRRRDTLVEQDHCDDCGTAMPLTGDSLCVPCAIADERRFQCPNCGHYPVMYLVEESRPDFCSDKCENEWEDIGV